MKLQNEIPTRPDRARFGQCKLWLTLALILSGNPWLWGQEGSTDFLRSTGKIYVVVAVIAAIFVGIVLFLAYLDRKLTKLENQINEK
jgi:CcmD family protein